MTASIIGLACLAALNPKLLVVDLLLMGNRRPLPMFVCFMLGGIGLAVFIGLGDVLVLQADAINPQGSASAGLDLALGIPLLAVGALLASGRLHRRQQRPHARPLGLAFTCLLAAVPGSLAAAPFAMVLMAAFLTQVGALQTAPILIAVVTAFLTMEGVKYVLASRKRARAAAAKPPARAERATPD